MRFKTILTWLVIAGVIWFLIEEPNLAAGGFTGIAQIIQDAARGLSRFLTSL